MKKRFLLPLIILLLLVCPLMVSCGDNNSNGSGDNGKLNAEQVYELIGPSVVNIEAESTTSISSGTGFFYNNGSTVVTNFHVIDGCYKASITLSTGQEYDVKKVLGYDEDKDIAILQVDYNNGKPVSTRTSEIKTGEKVFAIGNSLGFLGGSLSEGIVSTAQRELDGFTYIQTTVAITHGNSGGPLIDEYGKVIGITSAGYGDGLDLNLAIPISQVSTVSTANPKRLDEIVTYDVEWLADWELVKETSNNRYVLYFTLKDVNKIPVAVSGKANVKVVTDNSETVFDKQISFTVDDFNYRGTGSNKKLQVAIYINTSEISKGSISTGEVRFTVSGKGFTFDETVLDITGLAVADITELPTVNVTVYTAQELIDNITHNRNITLGSTYYDLSDVVLPNNALITRQEFSDIGITINNVYNLSISGDAEIVIDDLSATVLDFIGCTNLKLDGLTVGHIEDDGGCQGAVIYLTECDNAVVKNCSLYGCGSVGIWAYQSMNIKVENTDIYDCSYGGIDLTFSTATINNVSIYDMVCGEYGYAISFYDSTATFTNCEITNVNAGKIIDNEWSDETSATFNNCSFTGNACSVFVSGEEGLIFNSCVISGNLGFVNSTSSIFKNCTISNNTSGYTIPDVTYYSLTEASEILDSLEISYTVEYVYGDMYADCKYPYDKVISQSKTGVFATKETVKLVVSKSAIIIEQVDWDVNSVGGIEPEIKYTNNSNKQIAYIYFTIKFYDTVGYPAYCDVYTSKCQGRLKVTGPINAGQTKTSYWDVIIYDWHVGAIKPLTIEVQFTDGTTQTITCDGRYWYSGSYYGGDLHD